MFTVSLTQGTTNAPAGGTNDGPNQIEVNDPLVDETASGFARRDQALYQCFAIRTRGEW